VIKKEGYSMASIPGWAYIIIGIVMTVLSKMVEAKTKPGNFALFFWLGIVFVVIGVGKMAYKAIFKKGDKQPKQQRKAALHHRAQHSQNPVQQRNYQQFNAQQKPVHQARQGAFQQMPQQQAAATHAFHFQGQHEVHRANQQQPVQQPQHPSIIACHLCGVRHYDYANFCMNCGTRIKK
jgi:hypothetical protein